MIPDPTLAPLRVELRARNNRLWHFIFDGFPTVAAFARFHGIDNGQIGDFLNLRRSPYGADGEPLPVPQRLADLARLPVDELFPRDLYRVVLPRHMALEMEPGNFLPLAAARRLELPPAQEIAAERAQLQDAIAEVLATLPPRYAGMVRMHFGLDGDPQTLKEIGTTYGVSQERVRQVIAAALRRLRHPSRSRKLRTHLDPFRDRPVYQPESEEPKPESSEDPAHDDNR